MTTKKTNTRKEDKNVKLQRFANYAHKSREGMHFVLILVGEDGKVGCVSSLMSRRKLAGALRDTFAKLKAEGGVWEDASTAMKRAKEAAKELFL